MKHLKIILPSALVVISIALLAFAILQNPNKPTQPEQPSQQTTARHDAYANIDPAKIQTVASHGEFIWNFKDPYWLFNEYPIAATIEVQSIDGAINRHPVRDHIMTPQTIGKIKILSVYKGDLKPGSVVKYARVGAIMKFNDYLKGLEQVQIDKIMHLRKQDGITDTDFYIKSKFIHDIDIEVGKQYLAFLGPDDDKNGGIYYGIYGAQYGLRELRIDNGVSKILNNETKKWEPIETVIKK